MVFGDETRMITKRGQNIIVFSAGKSVRNRNLNKVKSFFEGTDHICCGWRELFKGAKNRKAKALLPLLIKKIPTFDFAIILCDGVDTLIRDEKNNSEEKIRIMRDNVLFECGLCIMALGPDRVILLMEKDVRIIDDLWGIGGTGNTAIKRIEYVNSNGKNKGDLTEQMQEVILHIDKKADMISPIVIGAAISTADGYLSNFILRFWENINKGFTDYESKAPILPDLSSIYMEILIPEKIDDKVKKNIFNYYDKNGYKRGLIHDAAFRGVDFRYTMTNDKFTVLDIPSTLTASYNTVEDILNLDADDKHDPLAKERFLTKEKDSFIFTLEKLMKEEALVSKLKTYPSYNNKTDGAKNLETMLQFIKNRVTIDTKNFDQV